MTWCARGYTKCECVMLIDDDDSKWETIKCEIFSEQIESQNDNLTPNTHKRFIIIIISHYTPPPTQSESMVNLIIFHLFSINKYYCRMPLSTVIWAIKCTTRVMEQQTQVRTLATYTRVIFASVELFLLVLFGVALCTNQRPNRFLFSETISWSGVSVWLCLDCVHSAHLDTYQKCINLICSFGDTARSFAHIFCFCIFWCNIVTSHSVRPHNNFNETFVATINVCERKSGTANI